VTGLSPPSKLGVFNNNLENGYRAFAERYFMCSVGGVFQPALTSTDQEWVMDVNMEQYCEELVKNLDLAPVASIREVVDCYKGAKKKVYLEASERYWRDGVRKMDAMLRSFVKFEKCALDKAPRVINPRSPIYNLVLGRFLKKNEHSYFDAIAKVFKQEKVVIKGVDAKETGRLMRGMWDQLSSPVAIGGDATKFDMHVSREALEFEHICYLRPYFQSYTHTVRAYRAMQGWCSRHPNDDMPKGNDLLQFMWLLCQQLDNIGKAYFKDGTLKFKMRGTRASGDLNTSLGNCILMSAMTYSWRKTCGVEALLANNGDDCQYFMEKDEEQVWRTGFDQFYQRKGFRMVLEDTSHMFEEVEFCQSRPVRVRGGWTMIRNPCTLITKASMCLLSVSNAKTLRKWMMAVGVAEGSLARGIPVLQSFARAMRRNGLRCTKRLIEAAYYQSNRVYHADLVVNDQEITHESRMSFYHAFGILPEEQMVLENYYDGWTCGFNLDLTIPSWDAATREAVPFAHLTELLRPGQI